VRQIVAIGAEVQMEENKKCGVKICKSLEINGIYFWRVIEMG
jgi:hypothetical protein